MENEMLEQRKKTHGRYIDYCQVAVGLKDRLNRGTTLSGNPTEVPLNISRMIDETLDAIASKLARIVTGDPMFIDHWEDIAGYATRAVEVLKDCSLSKNVAQAKVQSSKNISDFDVEA